MSAAVLKHFGLSHPPFQIAPETRFFFSGGKRMAILQALVEALNNYRGVIQVIGVAGSGKTLTCRMMLERVPPERVLPVYLGDTSLLPHESLQVLARALNVTLPQADEASMMAVLRQAARELRAQGRDVVVMVDEAQAMPADTFAMLYRLSCVEGDWLFRWVMFGQPELDDILGLPDLSEVRRAIVYKFTLEPLTVEDVARYIAHRLTIAAAPAQDMFRPAVHDIFTPSAVIAIADISLGVPRRINLFAEKALHAAAQNQASQIRVEHVLGLAGSAQQRAAALPEIEADTEAAVETEVAVPVPPATASTVEAVNVLPSEPLTQEHEAAVDHFIASAPATAIAVPGYADEQEDSGRLSFLEAFGEASIDRSSLDASGTYSLAALRPRRARWPYVVLAGVVVLVIAGGLLPFNEWLFGSGSVRETAAPPPTVPQAAAPNAGTIVSASEVAPPPVATVVVPPADKEGNDQSARAYDPLEPPAAGPAAAPSQPAAPSVATVPATPKPVVPALSMPAVPPQKIEPAATAQSLTPRATGNKTIDARLAAGQQWLDAAPADGGSIQLFVLSADNHDGLKHFLARYTSPEAKVRGTLDRNKIYLYLASLKGQMRLGVLYGEYVSRQAAADAIKDLPEPLRKLKPYPRSVQGLREEIGKGSDR